MQFYKGTGCHITLVGILTETPSIKMDEHGDFIALMGIHIKTSNQHKMNYYDVVVLGDRALHLKQYSFPGLRLWIEGDLCAFQDKSAYVVAKKITFLPDLEPSASSHLNYFTPLEKVISAVR